MRNSVQEYRIVEEGGDARGGVAPHGARGETSEARGKRQEARGERLEARGDRREAKARG
jgi:hypothetical protein